MAIRFHAASRAAKLVKLANATGEITVLTMLKETPQGYCSIDATIFPELLAMLDEIDGQTRRIMIKSETGSCRLDYFAAPKQNRINDSAVFISQMLEEPEGDVELTDELVKGKPVPTWFTIAAAPGDRVQGTVKLQGHLDDDTVFRLIAVN
jgi:hypothetical protein